MHAIPHLWTRTLRVELSKKKSDTKFRSASPLATWVLITQLIVFLSFFLGGLQNFNAY